MIQILSSRKARASEILLEIGAIECRPEDPFVFTSGWASPVYVNCRKIISTTRHRREIIHLLAEAIEAGGSSLRDFRQADGELGYFQHSFDVYGREGEPCRTPDCGKPIARIVQSGRSSFYCGQCQR